jgi:phage/plasmid-like protein (TIGR03299 family)
MPDMVETYAGPVAWWEGISPTVRERTLLDHNVRWDEMRVLAGLDWTVSKRPLTYLGEDDLTLHRMPDWRALVRDTDDAPLGLAKVTYSLYQNDELGTFGDAILDASGDKAHWHTAGSLLTGRLVWALAEISGEHYVKGDGSPLLNYLLLTTGHDGRHALRGKNTAVRVVCKNTCDAAYEGAGASFTVRHTSRMADRVEQARKALDINAKHWETLTAVLDSLATKPMTIDEVTRYTEVLLPVNPKAEHPYKTQAERAGIIALYQNSATLLGVPETAYRAYQATVEYLDYGKTFRGTKTGSAEDRRAVSIIEGGTADLKTNALRLLVKA